MAKTDMAASLSRVTTSPDELIYGPEALPAPRAAAPAATTPLVPKLTAAPEPAAPAPTAEAASLVPVARAVFTSQLNPDLYRRVRQYEYWAGMDLNEMLAEALEEYLADKPEARQELPPKVAAKKLKALVGRPAS